MLGPGEPGEATGHFLDTKTTTLYVLSCSLLTLETCVLVAGLERGWDVVGEVAEGGERE